jgi:hypothetical protein
MFNSTFLQRLEQSIADIGGVICHGTAFETVSGFVTAPSTTFTALTMSSGDSTTVKNTDLSKKALLLQAWAFNNVAGTLRIRSPKLHDNVQGIRWTVLAALVFPLMTMGYPQKVYPQDPLIVELTGSAVGGEIESAALTFYYEDLPGTAQRLASEDDIKKRGVNDLTVEIANNPGAGGGWTGQRAINFSFDLLQANTDYAILGGTVSAQCCAVGIRGPDSGNLRWAYPGEPTIRHVTMEWFVRLSYMFNMPLIPVFSSANKTVTNVDVTQDDEGTAVTTTLNLVQLAPK